MYPDIIKRPGFAFLYPLTITSMYITVKNIDTTVCVFISDFHPLHFTFIQLKLHHTSINTLNNYFLNSFCSFI